MDECIKKKKGSTCSALKISHYTTEMFVALTNIKALLFSFEQRDLFTVRVIAKMQTVQRRLRLCWRV